MRNIGSNKVTGPEGILIAAVMWWLQYGTGRELEQIIKQQCLDKSTPDRFTAKSEYNLGMEINDLIDISALSALFWTQSGQNPDIKFMIERAVLARKGSNSDNIKWAREFVHKLVISELGAEIKKSGYLEKHAKEIKTARRRKIRERRNG